MRRWLHLLGGLWLGMAASGVLHACRYSVRDTGFVDLGVASYRLEWHATKEFTAEQHAAWLIEAGKVLRDCNVPLPELRSARPGEAASLRLLDGQGRTLELGRPKPGDRLAALLEGIATSPTRERVLEECLRAYAVLLLFEGTDATSNDRASAAARAAMEGVSRLMPTMPKPVERGPALVVVRAGELDRERVLAWSLGLEPAPAPEARMAILYGRGRRLGTPLEGAMITATALRERLVLVGQDCECDLDREWLRGPLMPARWDESMQQAASKALGFDPENPMIRAEVSRIVERGPLAGQKRKMAGTSHALGYAEESVEGNGVEGEAREPGGKAPGGIGARDAAETRLGWAWATAGLAGIGVLLAAGWILWKGGQA